LKKEKLAHFFASCPPKIYLPAPRPPSAHNYNKIDNNNIIIIPTRQALPPQHFLLLNFSIYKKKFRENEKQNHNEWLDILIVLYFFFREKPH